MLSLFTLIMSCISFEVMLPYGSLLVSLQRVANPYEKIWARAEDVIAERTNASRQNNEHVSLPLNHVTIELSQFKHLIPIIQRIIKT